MKKYLRKQRHKRYVRKYLLDIRWEIINITISASAVGWTDATSKHICHLGWLIRKYERRMRWLRF